MTQTYGIFAVSPRAISIKDDKDTGWVADVKWAMLRGAHPERKFELEHMPVLTGSADSDGIKLEVTPRLDGEHLPPIMLPTNQRGNITISDEGDVLVTCRLTFHALDTAGLGVDAILNSSCCLECTVSDQPTLEEAIQGELEGQGALAFEGIPEEVTADRLSRQLQVEVADLAASVPPQLEPVERTPEQQARQDAAREIVQSAIIRVVEQLVESQGEDWIDVGTWEDNRAWLMQRIEVMSPEALESWSELWAHAPVQDLPTEKPRKVSKVRKNLKLDGEGAQA